MPSVSDFLIDRLQSAGIKHAFGVPGDYILGLYKKISDRPGIEIVNTTDESHAGFAADAYARVSGMGCVLATYNVGALKVLNAMAGAYAERSPVLLITGSPGIRERNDGMLLHHTVGDFNTQHNIFKNVTCASAVLDNPVSAGYEIDRVLEAMSHYKRPGYIEIPRDIAEKPISYDLTLGTPTSPKSDEENLQESVREVRDWIKSSKRPVILAGVEIARCGLGDELLKFASKIGLPIYSELLSKSVIPEDHHLFGGLYVGPNSQESVREAVEKSDCIIMLGVLLTDMTLGFTPAKWEKRQTIHATVQSVKVRNHSYDDVQFMDFCQRLFRTSDEIGKKSISIPKPKKSVPAKSPKGTICVAELFAKIQEILDRGDQDGITHAVISDIGDSLFGSMDLKVGKQNTFISPAFYTSMGMAIPASLGVQIAKNNLRPIVIVGDGAFQMSLSEISTLCDRKLNPIIFVLNNRGYTTERYILDGDFNNLRDWSYHKVSEIFGGCEGHLASNPQELDSAIASSLASRHPSIINVTVGEGDITPSLKRFTEGISKHI